MSIVIDFTVTNYIADLSTDPRNPKLQAFGPTATPLFKHFLPQMIAEMVALNDKTWIYDQLSDWVIKPDSRHYRLGILAVDLKVCKNFHVR